MKQRAVSRWIGGVSFFGFLLLAAGSIAAEEIHYDSGNRRDPFLPLVGPGGVVKQGFNPSGLNVEGIIYDPNHGSLALINGEFYKEKDRVGQATVAGIFRDHVILEQDQEKKTLWLTDEETGPKKNEKKPEPKSAKKN